MPGTNIVGWIFNILAVLLNGLALLQFMGQIDLADNLIPAVLVFDMIALPVVAWGAYRLGEMAEVQHFKDQVQKVAEQLPTHEEHTDTPDRDKLN